MWVTRQLPGGALALLLIALILASCDAGSTTSTRPSPTTAAPAKASATPTTTPQNDWQTYIDATYGFRLEVPAILQTTLPPNTGDKHYTFWQYNFAEGPPPKDQAIFAEVSVTLFASVTGGHPCTQGTAITIGSGVIAYEDDSLDAPTPTLPGNGASGPGGLDVNFETGGVYFHISLLADTGTPLTHDAFRARYGPIWQHILNSFVPGPPVPNTHPCG
jgi:hypothetical protein